jgi:hypothetical protein
MPKPTGLSRDQVKAQVYAKIEAEKALPASEQIANMLHVVRTTADAQELLNRFRAEVRAEAAAERDALQARLNAVLDICDREQRNAIRWENPIPAPEWVAPVQRAALGDDVRKSDGATIDIRDALRMLAGGAA